MDARSILAAVAEGGMSPFQLAAAILHLSKKQPVPPLVDLEGLLAQLVKVAQQLSARDVATAMTACARFKPRAAHPHDCPTLWTSWTTLCSEASVKAPQFNAQSIANTLNALAKFDHHDASLLAKLCAGGIAQGSSVQRAGHLQHAERIGQARSP